MKTSIIETKKEYELELSKIEALIDVTENSEASVELEILSFLVENYENIHHAIDTLSSKG